MRGLFGSVINSWSLIGIFFCSVWTSEMAKLREKGQTMFSNGSSLTNAESIQRVQAKEEEESSTDWSQLLASSCESTRLWCCILRVQFPYLNAWELKCNVTWSFFLFLLFVLGPLVVWNEQDFQIWTVHWIVKGRGSRFLRLNRGRIGVEP